MRWKYIYCLRKNPYIVYVFIFVVKPVWITKVKILHPNVTVVMRGFYDEGIITDFFFTSFFARLNCFILSYFLFYCVKYM